jgi:hypothetical protein
MFSSWRQNKRFSCKLLLPRKLDEDPVGDRLSLVPGFSRSIYGTLKILMVGGGGLNSEFGEGAVRKGVGKITILDGDNVEPSNLDRQRFFKKDIGKNKAIRLGYNLSREGFLGTEIMCIPLFFETAANEELIPDFDIALVGIDNNQGRRAVSRYCLKRNKPAIFSAVSGDANSGYCFLQQPGGPCFTCIFPEQCDDYVRQRCKEGAAKDILKVVGGHTLFILDSLFMDRKRNWNYYECHLAGFLEDFKELRARDPRCPICANASE